MRMIRDGIKRSQSQHILPYSASNMHPEFGHEGRVCLELAQLDERRRAGTGLVGSSHAHAHVLCLHKHAGTLGPNGLDNSLCNLTGQALLHLQPLGEDVSDACQLAQAYDAITRDVRDVNRASERQYVVLAQG